MQKLDEGLAIYMATKVPGRSDLCPRIGFYKIISVYQDFCFGKISTMATAHWKLKQSDAYSASIVCVQLQSFKKGNNPLITDNIIDCEIEVIEAVWDSNIPSFELSWQLLQANQLTLANINKLFSGKVKEFNISQVDSMSCGKEAEDGNY